MTWSFSGISSCMPELSILGYEAQGATPGLLSLTMADEKLSAYEAEISFVLGAGSKIPALISKGQEDTFTSCIATGFLQSASELGGLDQDKW